MINNKTIFKRGFFKRGGVKEAIRESGEQRDEFES